MLGFKTTLWKYFQKVLVMVFDELFREICLLSRDLSRKYEVHALQQEEDNLEIFMSFRHFVANYEWQVSYKAPHL
jgi:hypothetical protein